MHGNGSHAERSRYAHRQQPPFWEKFVAACGLLLVIALLGFLLFEALAGDTAPPNIVIELVEVRESGADHLVVFDVVNHGGETAQNVVIVGQLRRGDELIESAQATMDFIPAESTRRGGLFFEHDPRVAQLRLAPSGYSSP